jgi:cupin fold WbuC family metalloprotein
MSTVIRNTQDTIYIDKKKLEELKILAQNDPNKRARICLHKDDGEMIQEMIIAFCKDSYIRPHRHIDKSESYHIIEGRIEIIFYNDNGIEIDKVVLSDKIDEHPFLFRISNSAWHTVVPKSDFVIIHEVTKGPFNKNSSEFADWES